MSFFTNIKLYYYSRIILFGNWIQVDTVYQYGVNKLAVLQMEEAKKDRNRSNK